MIIVHNSFSVTASSRVSVGRAVVAGTPLTPNTPGIGSIGCPSAPWWGATASALTGYGRIY